MVNRAKQRGTAWEVRLVAYLREHGFPYASRLPLAGKNDVGDIGGVPLVCIEAKSHKSFDLASWIDEMVKEKETAGASLGVVIVPRRNHATGRAYVIQELDQWVQTIH